MVDLEAMRGKCGDCKYFDSKSIGGTELGTFVNNTFSSDGKELLAVVKNGVCRANAGLRFGMLNEEVSCRQPAGIFSPKNSIPKTLLK